MPEAPEQPETSFSLTMHVTDGGGVPVENALVTVLDPASRRVARGRTDPSGHAVLHTTGPGHYLVVVSAPPLAPEARYVTVSGDPMGRTEHAFIVGPRRTDPTTSVSEGEVATVSPVHPSRHDPDEAPAESATVGLAAALFATRILTTPKRYPNLIAASAALSTGTANAPELSRARHTATTMLLPYARRLLGRRSTPIHTTEVR